MEIDFDPQILSLEQAAQLVLQQPSFRRQSYSRQYRNVVFFHDSRQKGVFEKARAEMGRLEFDLEPYRNFTWAEHYHQKYELQNSPVMKDYQKMFADHTAFVNSTSAARANALLDGQVGDLQLEKLWPQLGLSDSSLLILQKSCGHHDKIRCQ